MLDRYEGGLLGLAIGDAVGTTVEFKQRGSFPPVTDMVGGGVFYLEPGQWTDDTSQALCIGQSLLEKDRMDLKDQMEKYWKWFNHGYMSSTGDCFDIGTATRKAIYKYVDSKFTQFLCGSGDPNTAGNGALMRLVPVPLFYYNDLDKMIENSKLSCLTTHGAMECLDACGYFASLIYEAMEGKSKEEILNSKIYTPSTEKVKYIQDGYYKNKSQKKIKSDGYVINSLEAALWSFYNTETFEEAILKVVNLGDDADTVGAICGQLAGVYYGKSSIRQDWIDKLHSNRFISILIIPV